jgi:hypothetical protein
MKDGRIPPTNLVELPAHVVDEGFFPRLQPPGSVARHWFSGLEIRVPIAQRPYLEGGYMRTLVVGLFIAIVCLATYFIKTMERIW